MHGTRIQRSLASRVSAAVVALASGIGVWEPPAHAQQPPAVGRPDLALTARDLTPDYRQIPRATYQVNGETLEVRAFTRDPTPEAWGGPIFVWNVTFQMPRPVSQPVVASLAQQGPHAFTETVQVAGLELYDWSEQEVTDLGEHAAGYRFRHGPPSREFSGDGAMVVFARGPLVSILLIYSLDGRAADDLHSYARIVDDRIAREAERL